MFGQVISRQRAARHDGSRAVLLAMHGYFVVTLETAAGTFLAGARFDSPRDAQTAFERAILSRSSL